MLIPHIEIRFTAPVWRMEIDESTDIICLEIRDVANKSVSFSSVDLKTGEQYIKVLTMPHGWQCGLDAAAFGIMLVHGYQSELLPVRKGLTAVDIKTGKVLWDNYNLNLEEIDRTDFRLYDTRVQSKKLFSVDANTGQIQSVSDGSETIASGIIYPHTIDAAAVKELGFADAVHGNTALFVARNGYRILSLHALLEGAITQYLYVYNQVGNVVFKDIIARDIQKLQPEAFIVYKDKLIWLQNRSVLKVLHL